MSLHARLAANVLLAALVALSLSWLLVRNRADLQPVRTPVFELDEPLIK